VPRSGQALHLIPVVVGDQHVSDPVHAVLVEVVQDPATAEVDQHGFPVVYQAYTWQVSSKR